MVLPSVDALAFIPDKIKLLFGIAIFFLFGVAIINVLLFTWNFFVVGGFNLINGCLTNSLLCIPEATGFYIFGINFADFWVLALIIFMPFIIFFAFKWYNVMLHFGGK